MQYYFLNLRLSWHPWFQIICTTFAPQFETNKELDSLHMSHSNPIPPLTNLTITIIYVCIHSPTHISHKLLINPMQMQPTLSMDNRRKKSTSGNSFSFPSTPNQDSDFEFGSLTPDSPSSDPCRTSPADHLFFNGRLQPHSFPVIFQQHHHPNIATSRTSSISSKDSLVSSRSNSTNSRGSSSCSSSARTSSSDSSERRLFHNKVSSSSRKGAYMVNRSVASSAHHQAYGCSQRWQYITPVPALNRDASKRRRGDMKQQGRKEEGTKRMKKKKKEKARGVRLRFGRRIFRWFVMACRECHAMEPSKANNKEIMLQENVKT